MFFYQIREKWNLIERIPVFSYQITIIVILIERSADYFLSDPGFFDFGKKGLLKLAFILHGAHLTSAVQFLELTVTDKVKAAFLHDMPGSFILLNMT